ncbi:transposase [Staphylococcus caeli]|uniref:Transposase n=1 Tax=Staphylococcus caeli TaxID=2201815 RepID=A0A1D4PZ49_9STAP|nr:transposase [Staphylococcus caeli]SCT28278.1 putative transposase [Staphylococcus caeli]SCT33846.1 putative transposase [Staphylococcus caeli]
MAKRKKREEVDYYTRLAIAKYISEGKSIAETARIINRNYRVVYDELRKRSDENGQYNPVLAEEHAIESRSFTAEDIEKRRALSPKTKAYIEEKLALKWSPRQIASQIEVDTGVYISYPTIYRYIRKGLVHVNRERDLRYGGKKYTKSTEKRGKLDVGHRVIRYRPSKSK